ncbi:MAG: DUF4160 domain-containing protein [Chloroflexi bacterium]|nr:DUF4160 domain-containing protein [Chloroflexota bacterium]
MPEICRFYGIVIRMYANDHSPPHFHALYGEYEALMAIHDLEVLRGFLPARALRLVMEWASLHQDELQEDWERSRNLEPPLRIAPLE